MQAAQHCGCGKGPIEAVRRALPAVVAVAAVMSAGCGDEGGRPRVAERLAREPAAASAPTADSAEPVTGGPAVALVNGRPIALRELVRVLLDGRGLAVLQRMVQLEAARQEGERLGLSVSAADVEREYDLALRGERFNGKDVEALTPARREQLIDEWTVSRGVTRQELDITVKRQAWLRKIVGDAAQPTEEQVRAEFDRRHGEKAEVRHIQIPAERTFTQIQRRLSAGERFEDLVAEYSQNAFSRERRGLLPPFTRNAEDVPAVFREAAFRMTPGEVSNPIAAEGSFHVLRLERLIPADDVTFEAAREQAEAAVRLRLTEARMEELGRRLLLQSSLQIEDKTLREQYRTLRDAKRMEGPPLTGR